MNTTAIRSLSAALILGAAVFATAGCATDSGKTDAASSPAGTLEQQSDKYWADFDACIAKAGFDPKDESLNGPDAPAAFKTANQKCSDELGPRPGAADLDDPAQQAAVIASAKAEDGCYRDRGYEVPEYDPAKEDGTPEDVSQADLDACMTIGQKAFDEALAQHEKN